MEGLRYNKVIVATDADVDGMHIRLLLITFFLQFLPDSDKDQVYILQTPLFRVRNRKKGVYETVYSLFGRRTDCRYRTVKPQIQKLPDSKVWERSHPMNSSTLSAKTCVWSKFPSARLTW